MAYEIHDGLVQDMTAGLWHLESLSRARPQSQSAGRRDLGSGHRFAAKLDRRGPPPALRASRPPILDEAGVVLAIQYLVAEQSVPGSPRHPFLARCPFRSPRLVAGREHLPYRAGIADTCIATVAAAPGEVPTTQTGDQVHYWSAILAAGSAWRTCRLIASACRESANARLLSAAMPRSTPHPAAARGSSSTCRSRPRSPARCPDAWTNKTYPLARGGAAHS